MTAIDDRDPRIAELLERHTPAQPGAPDWARVTGRRGARRLLRPAMAAAGAAVAVVALIAGIVAAPGGDDHRGAAPLTYAQQSEGGVALRLRMTPRAGESAEQASLSAATALDARAKADGYTVLTDPHRDGTLDVWVPVARSSKELTDLLAPADAALFDSGSGRVAEGPSLPAVLDAAEAVAPRGAGETLYLLDGRGRPVQGPAPDLASLRRMLGGTGGIPKEFTLRYVPAGYTLIADLRWTRFEVQRGTPLISGADIASVTTIEGSATGLAVSLTAAGRARWAAASLTGSAVNLVVYSEVGPATIYATVDASRSTAGRLVATTRDARTARYVAGYLAGGTVPGRPEVILEHATGAAPVTGGDRADLPGATERMLTDAMTGAQRTLAAGSLRRMVRLDGPGGEWSVWVAHDTLGEMWEVVVDPRMDGAVVGGGSTCVLSPAHPVVRMCGTGPGYAYGRVADAVARLDGADRTAVGNGWFLAVDDTKALNAPAPKRITGFAADGEQLAVASAD